MWIRIVKKYLAITQQQKRKSFNCKNNCKSSANVVRLHRELQQTFKLINTLVDFLKNHRIYICYISMYTRVIFITLQRFFQITIYDHFWYSNNLFKNSICGFLTSISPRNVKYYFDFACFNGKKNFCISRFRL